MFNYELKNKIYLPLWIQLKALPQHLGHPGLPVFQW